MDARYDSFVAYLTHVGYTRETSVPSVLIITHNFSDTDAKEVIALFAELGCQHVKRVFCYEGDIAASAGWADESEMREYSAKPNPGASIGVENQHGCFSLGPYVRLHDDPHHYALSVHHGMAGATAVPINPTISPPVLLQQPAYDDVTSETVRLANLLTDPAGASLHDAERELEEWRNLDFTFARAVWSEFTVVDYEERRMTSDWVLIQVEPERAGTNHVASEVGKLASENKWVPRDKSGVYLRGKGDLQFGSQVSKTGPATGWTRGVVSLRHGFVKLGAPTYTMEYTITNSEHGNRFSEQGDSGAVVFNARGEAVAMVLGGSVGERKVLKGHESLGRVCCSYLTPLSLVFARIKRLTGKDVELVAVDLDTLPTDGLVRGKA